MRVRNVGKEAQNVKAATPDRSVSTLAISVVIPVFKDAASVSILVQNLAQGFAGSYPDAELRIVLIDDGSPEYLAHELQFEARLGECTVEVLRLGSNVGHQRAIALGIAYVHEQMRSDVVLVMDADGEDCPEDAIRLVERISANGGRRIVFAERTRRSESILFQLCYRVYQLLHWVLTGIRVRVGNFSAVPGRCLPALVTLPALWNHYAAAIFQSKLPIETLPTERGHRYFGRSQMNFLSLAMHGLQAISVFSHIVAVRILVGVIGLCALGIALLFAGLRGYLSLSGQHVGWEAYGWAALCLLVLLALGLGMFSLVLALMSQRNSLDFLPIRDYKYFIQEVQVVYSTPTHYEQPA